MPDEVFVTQEPSLQDREQERELVRRCLIGEAPAWEEFVHRYFPLLSESVRRTFLRFEASQDPSQVQDIVQDLFLSLLKSEASALKSFGWQCSLKHWLVVLAANRTVDRIRLRKPGISMDSGLAEESLFKEIGPFASPSETAESGERTDRLRRAIGQLSPKEQAALRLFYWDQLPSDGIGQLLKLPSPTVRSLLMRARDKLRHILSQSLLLL